MRMKKNDRPMCGRGLDRAWRVASFEMDCLEEVAEDRRAKEERWINKLRGEGHRLFNIRSAAVMVIGIADMSNETKRGVVAQYLDKFGDDHDGPWMKEAKWVYIV
jgi:hypothetical protein